MDNELPVVTPLSAQALDFFIVGGSILLVALLTFIWALFFRKSGKRRRKHRHRRHSRLNPTLAETGGLPPIREEIKSSAEPPPTPQT
jgi:hypothetical protein